MSYVTLFRLTESVERQSLMIVMPYAASPRTVGGEGVEATVTLYSVTVASHQQGVLLLGLLLDHRGTAPLRNEPHGEGHAGEFPDDGRQLHDGPQWRSHLLHPQEPASLPHPDVQAVHGPL